MIDEELRHELREHFKKLLTRTIWWGSAAVVLVSVLGLVSLDRALEKFAEDEIKKAEANLESKFQLQIQAYQGMLETFRQEAQKVVSEARDAERVAQRSSQTAVELREITEEIQKTAADEFTKTQQLSNTTERLQNRTLETLQDTSVKVSDIERALQSLHKQSERNADLIADKKAQVDKIVSGLAEAKAPTPADIAAIVEPDVFRRLSDALPKEPIFTQIEAAVSTIVADGAHHRGKAVSCPASSKLIYASLVQHNATTTKGWHYCECETKDNSVFAVYNSADGNPNGVCRCSGLCVQ